MKPFTVFNTSNYSSFMLIFWFYDFEILEFSGLKDAAGLTQLSSTVEEVFASGDLPRAAETLANMRHCLSAVGEVSFDLLVFT